MRTFSVLHTLRFYFLALFLFTSFSGNTQTLNEKLRGLTNFEEIRNVAEDYYANLRKSGAKRHQSDPKYKHWKRWEWYHKDRTDPQGNIQTNQLDVLKINKAIKKSEASATRSTNSDWTFVGPTDNIPNPTSTSYIGLGRVDRIAFHPTDPNTIFIGTPAGGLWKTTDDGNTWTALDDYLPSLGISGICISPSNPNLMYVLTGCGDGLGIWSSSGVFKSIDGGETWTNTAQLSEDNFTGYAMVMDPNNDQVLYVATNIGLFTTGSGGNTWFNFGGGKCFDVKLKPGDASTIYVAQVSKMLYTFNSGANWHESNLLPAPDSLGRTAIAVTADDPNRVYLHMGPEKSETTFNGFYYSGDSGQNFVQVATSPNIVGPQSVYDFCVTASPVSKNIVIAGGLTCWRSTNSGSTWNEITTYGAGSNLPGYVHPDIHALAFNPLNNHLYCANDGGFYKSTDTGNSWTNLSKGIETTMFYHMSETPLDPNYVIGGTQDNGIKLRKSNSEEFDHVAGADGFSTKFYPNDKTKYYASINTIVKRYWNNGGSFASITPKEHWLSELAVHQTNKDILFAGTNEEGGRLYKSTNEGSSWDTLFLSAGDAIITCPSNYNKMYFAGNKKIFVSYDLGITADSINDNPGFPSEYGNITDLAVSPYTSIKLYATISGKTEGLKVMQTLNSGASWTNISGTLPNVPANCIAVTSGGDLYLGTDIGVFFKAASAADWVPYRNGMPATIVTDLSINESQNTIRASTFGRGIWVSPLSDGNCQSNLVWSAITEMEGYHYYEASNSIVNKSILSGGMTTNVFMKSGNFIDLKEGFHAKNDGLYFKAFIGPCNTGGIPELKQDDNQNNR
jgi:photosystem II stability/assembly factor-like uncharacterized protein